MNCTDIAGIAGVDNANTWGGRFYDNGYYIGHDEPDLTFLSSRPGTGNNVTWLEKLGSDPKAAPTVASPGSDVAHWFELSPAPWFSMAMCDANSYPQQACAPQSDANAPSASYEGSGSAFMEMQFYPPGFAPFSESVSCDNAHWCAALTIDSLECTLGFASCNPACEEPVNFAFIQTNGVPTGPPSPQLSNTATFTPNRNTLLMNPGDTVAVSMKNAPVPHGGGNAFKVNVTDFTTHQTGYMQASAANGFQRTSIADCSGTPTNFQPEYSTASKANIVPWAALQTNISTEFETGHFEACTAVSDAVFNGLGGAGDPVYNECTSPYETTSDTGTAELGEAACYPIGDTHGTLGTPPNLISGCIDSVYQNGDLDFDGTPYWPEWPTSTRATAKLPASFIQSPPVSRGRLYSSFMFQTDLALSESSCTATDLSGCAVPAPSSPGNFYPYWSVAKLFGGGCAIEFGNVSGPGANDFGKDAQYGTNLFSTLGYPEFESAVHPNTCRY
ncbi:hypothetical protein [Arthrobacter dokdonensis]|uniref:hypothetical protein n=1 Tax=Arthrobacter dokdonellae TaxID=2211210 RepID=UPI001013C5F6|nr:hypothetical protein [Arthrobacter dokdonellae]